MVSAVFLDRDGVINQTEIVMGKPIAPKTISDLKILPGVIEAIKNLKSASYEIVVVTNQPDIANGLVSAYTVHEINRVISEITSIEHFFVCPHNDRNQCDCRKPKPGLLKQASRELGIDLFKSYLVGDRCKDIEAGQAAGCKNFFIDYSYIEKKPQLPFMRVKSLYEAAALILKESWYGD